MPDTKPDLKFDQDGICDACTNFPNRKEIDWNKRKKQLFEIVDKYKQQSNWDCIVPVSGGKDSTFQVVKNATDGH